MRYFLTFLATAAVAFSGNLYAEGFLEPGTRSVRVDTTYDDSAGGEHVWGYEVGVGGGLFPADDFGLFYGYNKNDVRREQTIGFYVEEHYTTWSPLIPFIGLASGWVNVDPDQAVTGLNENLDAWMIRGQAGLKFLLSENIALSAQYLYAWSNEEIYFRGNPSALRATTPFWSFGVRFYY